MFRLLLVPSSEGMETKWKPLQGLGLKLVRRE